MTTKPAELTLSGLYYPNKMMRIFLEALADVMGQNGLNALLNQAKLSQYIAQLPPENLDRQVDFAHISALIQGLETLYGERGARGLALRAGRALFGQGLKGFGALAGVGDLAFKVLPLPVKLKMGIPAVASIFTNFSDQTSVTEEKDDHYLYTIKVCSQCWGRTGLAKPSCHVATGILQEAMRWVSGGREFRINQIRCKGCGDADCAYVIYKEPID
jgi:predicted hydrocarbon binding protein